MKGIHWVRIFQGLLGILFGVLIIVWPIKSLVFITWILGLFLLLNSVFLIITGLLSPKTEHRPMTVIFGFLTLLAAIVVMSGTVTVLKALVFIFALWSLVAGIIQIIIAIFRRETDEELNAMLIFSGLFSLLVALLLFVYPVQTIGFVQVVIGLGVLAGGLATLIHAVRTK